MRKMNKAEIIKSAETRHDEERDCWVTRSYVDDGIIGVADTAEESRRIFMEMVEAEWDEYQRGRHGMYATPGRPAKNKVDLRAQVEPEIKIGIVALSSELGTSHGEAVEYLFRFYQGFKAGRDHLAQA